MHFLFINAATVYSSSLVQTALHMVIMVHPSVGALRPIMYICIIQRFYLCILGGVVPPMNSVVCAMNSVILTRS